MKRASLDIYDFLQNDVKVKLLEAKHTLDQHDMKTACRDNA